MMMDIVVKKKKKITTGVYKGLERSVLSVVSRKITLSVKCLHHQYLNNSHVSKKTNFRSILKFLDPNLNWDPPSSVEVLNLNAPNHLAFGTSIS